MNELEKAVGKQHQGGNEAPRPSGISPRESIESLPPVEKIITGIALAIHTERQNAVSSRKAITSETDQETTEGALASASENSSGDTVEAVYRNPLKFEVINTNFQNILPKYEAGKIILTFPIKVQYATKTGDRHIVVPGELVASEDAVQKMRELVANPQVRTEIVKYLKEILPASSLNVFSDSGQYLPPKSKEGTLVPQFLKALSEERVAENLEVGFVTIDHAKLGGVLKNKGLALQVSLPISTKDTSQGVFARLFKA